MGGQNTESPGGCKAFGESGLTPVKRRDINEMVEPILVRVLDQHYDLALDGSKQKTLRCITADYKAKE